MPGSLAWLPGWGGDPGMTVCPPVGLGAACVIREAEPRDECSHQGQDTGKREGGIRVSSPKQKQLASWKEI